MSYFVFWVFIIIEVVYICCVYFFGFIIKLILNGKYWNFDLVDRLLFVSIFRKMFLESL